MLIVVSGSCSGEGEKSRGGLRPRGPSGDDCNETVDGLAVDEVPFGVNAVAGVTVNGTDVLMYCLFVPDVDSWEGVGDGQQPLLLLVAGDVCTEGAISDQLRRLIHWIASSLRCRGCVPFRGVGLREGVGRG